MAASVLPLNSQEKLEEALLRSDSDPVILYKHSRTCPVSAWARRQMDRLHEEGDPPVYELVVQQDRNLSDEIADHFNIRHATPQAIVIYKRRPVFNASHRRISAEALRTMAHRASSETNGASSNSAGE